MATPRRSASVGSRRLWPAVLLLCVVLEGIRLAQRPAATATLWTVRVGTTPTAVTIAARWGRIVVANGDDHSVSLLDTRSGAVVATMALGASASALAVDESRGRAFTLNTCPPVSTYPPCQPGVSVLDLQRGTLLATVHLPSSAGTLALDEQGGRLFVTDYYAGTLRVLLASTGALRQMVDVGGPPTSVVVDSRQRRACLGIVGRNARVSLLDTRTGTVLRTIPVGQFVGAVLTDARAGRLLVYSDQGLALLDTRIGQLLRVIKDGGLPLAVDERDGRALVVAHGQLRLLATRDGRIVGVSDAGGASRGVGIDAVAVDGVAGRFYVAAHGVVRQLGRPTTVSRLLVLDGRNGALRVHALPETAVALSVDGATHRLVVLSRGPAGAARPEDTPPRWARWLRQVLPWLPLPLATPSAGGTVMALDTTHL